MKTITAALFAELKSQNARIDAAWLIVRVDGSRFAFTSSDTPFVYNGDTYSPTNGFNPSAIVSKANLSVDNMECQVLDNALITDADLRAGVWNNAQVQVFWINALNPNWGIVPMRGGMLGEIVIKDGQWTTQLRSLFQQLQQPFGYFYTLQCGAQLGDARCKVKLIANTWRPNTAFKLGLLTDASVGDVVKPTTPNGFWYVANYATRGPSEAVQEASSATGVSDPTSTVTYTDGSSAITTTPGGTSATYDASAERTPSQPGQGLSGNDDLGPNDNTQTSAGPAFDNLNQFTYTGDPVDIFGIKI
jgi:uncharacterized phage protein (TIGR02218 family)